jgi:hypothetical protein
MMACRMRPLMVPPVDADRKQQPAASRAHGMRSRKSVSLSNRRSPCSPAFTDPEGFLPSRPPLACASLLVAAAITPWPAASEADCSPQRGGGVLGVEASARHRHPLRQTRRRSVPLLPAVRGDYQARGSARLVKKQVSDVSALRSYGRGKGSKPSLAAEARRPLPSAGARRSLRILAPRPTLAGGQGGQRVKA